MYLYVEMFDTWGAWNDAELGGKTSSHSRIVKIELTPEQIVHLKPRVTGISGGKDMHETANPICLQDD